ncbi:recombinase family protein [Hoyosella rhizosphaerae]|uniref:recombinase family protein n=1 Tax=Hoyosella rhizosphaerae TaxID=1755582 RepID=UPI0027DD99C7|nr:recombinase family protein [Hoyosella rhizosphaerae]
MSEYSRRQSRAAKIDRPQLAALVKEVQTGDVVVVWRLDGLGRSLPHLIETVEALRENGVEFRSMTESIDTAPPGGTQVFHIFGALAQFERDLIRERTNAGLRAARERGSVGGPHPRRHPRNYATHNECVITESDSKKSPTSPDSHVRLSFAASAPTPIYSLPDLNPLQVPSEFSTP